MTTSSLRSALGTSMELYAADVISNVHSSTKRIDSSKGLFRNISSEKDSSGKSMILLKVLLTLLDVWLERLRTGLPSCRTDLAKFVREFERLNQTQGFVH